MADYLTLEEVLAELQIDEGKLRELTASGQLRSFRDQGVEKFRRGDVMKLKGAAGSQPTIVLPSSGADKEPTAPTEPPPIQLEDESAPDQADESESQTVIPTIELSFDEDQASSSETMIPTIELSPEEGVGVQETAVPTEAIADIGDEATDVATEEVALADDDYVILEDQQERPGGGLDFSDTDTDTSEDFATDTATAAEAAGLEFEEEPASHAAFTVLLGLSAVLMLAAVYLFIAAVRPPMHPKLYDFFLDLGMKLGVGKPL